MSQQASRRMRMRTGTHLLDFTFMRVLEDAIAGDVIPLLAHVLSHAFDELAVRDADVL